MLVKPELTSRTRIAKAKGVVRSIHYALPDNWQKMK